MCKLSTVKSIFFLKKSPNLSWGEKVARNEYENGKTCGGRGSKKKHSNMLIPGMLP